MRSIFLITLFFTYTLSFSQSKVSFEGYTIDFQLSDILSASGIEQINDKTYIISDNQNVLFIKKDKEIQAIPLNPSDNIKKVQKKDKKDFESLCYIPYKNKDLLMIVSSGSHLISRDTIYLFNTKKQKIFYKKNVRELYNNIQKKMGLAKGQLINIEASTLVGENILLFHRGNESGQNYLIEISKMDFMNYITNDKNPPDFKLKKINLPVSDKFIEKALPGISGAYTLKNNTILISYSLEATKSNYTDGEILASYIGILNTENMLVSSIIIPDKENPNKARIIKAEGVISKTELKNNSIIISTVSDNDNDKAEYLEIEITLE